MWSTEEVPHDFQDSDRLQQLVREAVESFESGSQTAEQLQSVQPASLKTLYAFAYRFYRDGQYEKARDFFRFLALLEPDDKRHWMGLGGAEQMCANYSPALQAYAFAGVLDPSDPFPHFHAAECYGRLEDWEQAHKALAASETFVTEAAEFRVLRARILLMRQNWPEARTAS